MTLQTVIYVFIVYRVLVVNVLIQMNILTYRLSDADGSLKFSLEKEGPVGLKDFDGNVRFFK